MDIKLKMNKTTIAVGFVSVLEVGLAHASMLAPNTTYDMFIRTGTSCYGAGDDCTTSPQFRFTDNAGTVDFNGTTYGSSIGGDGWAGVVRFKTDAIGDSFTTLSYNLDKYPPGPPDEFVSWTDNPELMTGTVDAAGNMTFTPAGRMAISGFFGFIGVQPWNFDDSTNTVAPTTNAWSSFTTGTSTGQVTTISDSPISLTGNPLTADGSGGWDAVLVSSSNFGDSWGPFTGAPYTEIWDVNIQTVVPVPAAAWLFGSGLLGLIGYARRRV